MTARFWLDALPSTDPVFAPLQNAEHLSDPADWRVIEQAHKQACSEAAWGKPLAAMDAKAAELREYAARMHERDADGEDDGLLTSADLEALGYALGVTAVRVAIRQHHHTDMGRAA